jgi:hypothetical protein
LAGAVARGGAAVVGVAAERVSHEKPMAGSIAAPDRSEM